MGLINRTIEFKNDFVMLQLYKSLVRPHMDYCVQVWRPHLQKDIALLESIQRRYTKRIVSCKNLPYDDRLKHLGLMTVNDRMMRADLIEIYKIMHAIDDLDFNCYFDLNRSVTRGNDFKLFKKRKNKSIGLFSFSARAIDCWNKLPNFVVQAESLNVFKRRLQEIWYK